MTDEPIKGVQILDVTGSGCTPDGRYIWLHFRLPQGNEHNFFFDVAHVDKAIGMLHRAARRAHELQGAPAAPGASPDLPAVPTTVDSISLITSPRHDGVILQASGSDATAVALLLPMEIARQLAVKLPDVVETIAVGASGAATPHLH